ncbi:unnamed protein product [Camellia sinensis]
MEAEEANKADSSPSTTTTATTDSETLVSATEPNQQPTRHQNPLLAVEAGGENRIGESKSISSLDQKEIVRALEILERDSVAIAESFTSLFASLRLALSEATSTSVDHMHCFSDAAGRLQECALDAATKGNRYINSCLRLNEEMKGVDSLGTQLYPWFCIKILRRNVDTLDLAVVDITDVFENARKKNKLMHCLNHCSV